MVLAFLIGRYVPSIPGRQEIPSPPLVLNLTPTAPPQPTTKVVQTTESSAYQQWLSQQTFKQPPFRFYKISDEGQLLDDIVI